MDLAWSATDTAFRDEVRAFLQDRLTPELRLAGRLMTSVYADHEASMGHRRMDTSAARHGRPSHHCATSTTGPARSTPAATRFRETFSPKRLWGCRWTSI